MLELQLAGLGAAPFGRSVLLPLLEGYKRPNDKIADWLDRGVLVSLKRGLYVVGEPWRQQPLSLPLVANHLYGPSCVSLDFALSWHGLIPERVHEVTSVCMRRGRVFDNDLGRFSYATLPKVLFPAGVLQEQDASGQFFLMASPAKAVCDKLLLTRGFRASGHHAIRAWLLDDLRVDESALPELDVTVVRHYLAAGHKPRQLQALLQLLESLR